MKRILSSILGPVGIQLVGLLFIPIIARIYGPDAYGKMNLLVAYAIIFYPAVAGCYPMAIVLPRSKKRAEGLVTIALLLTLVNSAVVAIICAVISLSTSGSDLGAIAAWLPVSILCGSIWNIHNHCLIYERQFFLRSSAQILQALMIGIGRITAADGFGPNPLWLMSSAATMNSMNSVIALCLQRERSKSLRWNIWSDFGYLKKIARHYFDFPRYRMPQLILNGLSQAMPITLIALMFDTTSAGYFGLARTLIVVTTNSIGQSVGDVIYASYAERHGKKESLALDFVRHSGFLFGVSFIILVSFSIFMPKYIPLILGSQWAPTTQFFLALSFSQACAIGARPAFALSTVLGRQKIVFSIELWAIVSRAVAMTAAYLLYGSQLSVVAGFALASSLFYLVIYISGLRGVRER